MLPENAHRRRAAQNSQWQADCKLVQVDYGSVRIKTSFWCDFTAGFLANWVMYVPDFICRQKICLWISLLLFFSTYLLPFLSHSVSASVFGGRGAVPKASAKTEKCENVTVALTAPLLPPDHATSVPSQTY